jgi:hypothetical protein
MTTPAPVVLQASLNNYVPSNVSPFTGAEAQYLMNELQKLQRSISASNAAITQLAAAV